MASMSLVAVPAVLAAKRHAAAQSGSLEPVVLTQMRHIYNAGIRIAPPAAVVSALCHLANAYVHYAPTPTAAGNMVGSAWGTGRSKVFAAAAALAVGIVPFTLLVLAPVNDEIFAREDEGRGLVVGTARRISGSTEDLIGRWGLYNLVRSVFPTAATLLAFQAL